MRLNRFFHITIQQGSTSYESGTDFGITAGSMKLDEMLCEGEFSLRQLCASKFEVQCFNLSEDVSGWDIIVTCDITEGTNGTDDVVNTIPIFVGIIDSSTTDNFNDFRDIIAYDRIYTLRDENVGEWWDTFWDSRPAYTEVSYPTGSPVLNKYYEYVNSEYVLSQDTQVNQSTTYYYGVPIATLGQIRASLCTEVGLTVVSTTLINDDIQVKEYLASANPDIPTQISFGNVMSMICEINGVFGHINREGKFEYTNITDSDIVQIFDNEYEKVNASFEDYETQQITGINVFESDNQLMMTYGDGETNAYSISGNMFTLTLDGYAVLETMCVRLMNILLNVQYTPCSIPLIVSSLDILVGNKVVSDRGNHFVLAQSYTGSMLVDQTINSPAYGEVLSSVKSVNNETIIKNSKYSTLFRDQEMLQSTIVNISADVQNNTADISQITQDAQSFTGYFSSMAGSQYIRMTSNGIQISESAESTAQTLITNKSFSVIDDQGIVVASMIANEFDTTNWVYQETRNGNCLNIFRRRT